MNITEFDTYIAPDGRSYNLHSPEIRWVLSRTGTGMPPIQWLTERGPFQHGESIKSFRLRPRTIQMIIRHNYNDRQQYFHGRLQILDVLRPNRQIIGQVNPGTLRKSFSDGSKIDIDVVIQEGPAFEPEQGDQWQEQSFQEVIRFIAHNPVFYNPYLRVHDFINVPGEEGGEPEEDPLLQQLVFPIHFSASDGLIIFNRNIGAPGGDDGDLDPEDDPNVIVYRGNWIEYPTIILTGPLSSPIIITNTTTGERIQLNYDVQPLETVTITLTYGIKTITSDLFPGLSLMGYLDPLSDIGSFHLEPGQNDFNIVITGQNSDSVVQMQYKDRYVGY